MVLDNVLLSPLGLLALLATLPLLVLYLVRPDPAERDLPTIRFLTDDRGEDASTAS